MFPVGIRRDLSHLGRRYRKGEGREGELHPLKVGYNIYLHP
jgi:hypothetical protein